MHGIKSRAHLAQTDSPLHFNLRRLHSLLAMISTFRDGLAGEAGTTHQAVWVYLALLRGLWEKNSSSRLGSSGLMACTTRLKRSLGVEKERWTEVRNKPR